jgi:PTS system glucose-specific IIA component/PTS system N-acetylglucosamine-specific IIA component
MPPVDILAPFGGRVIALADVPDPVFSGEVMGGGLAIDPAPDAGQLTVVAPCVGLVSKVFPGGHGIALETAGGALLVHLGIDTVELKGAGLHPVISEGFSVAPGTPMVEVNAAEIRAKGVSLVSPIVGISGQRIELVATPGSTIRAGEPLFRLHPAP